MNIILFCNTNYFYFLSCAIKCYKKTVSTGNLKMHLQNAHNIGEKKSDNIVTKRLSDFFTVQPRKRSCGNVTTANKWKLGRDIVLWLCKDLLPFSTVEKSGFQDFLMKYNVIQSTEDLPLRSTLSRSALDDVYNTILPYVKELISNGPKFSSLTCDLWTDNYRRKSYITFTYHHVTNDFKLEYFTLCTKIFSGRHTGIAIKNEILEVKTNFNLQNKELTFVTDRGSNIILALNLCDAENIFCVGHGLHNLITVDGFRENVEVSRFITKVKNIVRALRYRSSDLEKEADEVQQKIINDIDNSYELLENELNEDTDFDYANEDNIPLSVIQNMNDLNNVNAMTDENRKGHKTLKTSSATRWHSILMMLESIGSQRKAVNTLLSNIDRDELKLSYEESTLLFNLIQFLNEFRIAVEVLSAEKTCTLNYVLLVRSEIKSVLQNTENNENQLIKTMKQTMFNNFDHRFPVNDLVILGSLLDPRFKNLSTIDDYLKLKNVTKVEFLVSQVKHFILENNNLVVQKSSNTEKSCEKQDYIEKLRRKHSTLKNQDSIENDVEAECSLYLANASIYLLGIQLLQFWKEQSPNLPHLSKLAQKILCVPATSTPSERVFSVAGLTVTSKRSSLSPANVNKIIFVHDNYEKCNYKFI